MWFIKLAKKKKETYAHTKTCIQIFLVALFLIIQNRKKSKYPSMHGLLNKLWYINNATQGKQEQTVDTQSNLDRF